MRARTPPGALLALGLLGQGLQRHPLLDEIVTATSTITVTVSAGVALTTSPVASTADIYPSPFFTLTIDSFKPRGDSSDEDDSGGGSRNTDPLPWETLSNQIPSSTPDASETNPLPAGNNNGKGRVETSDPSKGRGSGSFDPLDSPDGYDKTIKECTIHHPYTTSKGPSGAESTVTLVCPEPTPTEPVPGSYDTSSGPVPYPGYSSKDGHAGDHTMTTLIAPSPWPTTSSYGPGNSQVCLPGSITVSGSGSVTGPSGSYGNGGGSSNSGTVGTLSPTGEATAIPPLPGSYDDGLDSEYPAFPSSKSSVKSRPTAASVTAVIPITMCTAHSGTGATGTTTPISTTDKVGGQYPGSTNLQSTGTWCPLSSTPVGGPYPGSTSTSTSTSTLYPTTSTLVGGQQPNSTSSQTTSVQLSTKTQAPVEVVAALPETTVSFRFPQGPEKGFLRKRRWRNAHMQNITSGAASVPLTGITAGPTEATLFPTAPASSNSTEPSVGMPTAVPSGTGFPGLPIAGNSTVASVGVPTTAPSGMGFPGLPTAGNSTVASVGMPTAVPSGAGFPGLPTADNSTVSGVGVPTIAPSGPGLPGLPSAGNSTVASVGVPTMAPSGTGLPGLPSTGSATTNNATRPYATILPTMATTTSSPVEAPTTSSVSIGSSAMPGNTTSAASASPSWSTTLTTPWSWSTGVPVSSSMVTSGSNSTISSAAATETSAAAPSPKFCEGSSSVGNMSINFDDLAQGQVWNPYRDFWFSEGFMVQQEGDAPFEASSGEQLVEFVPASLSEGRFNNTHDLAMIGMARTSPFPCFRWNLYGLSLGCASTATNQDCRFEVWGLRYNQETGREEFMGAWKNTTTPGCTDDSCTLTHMTFEGYQDISSVIIWATSDSQIRLWWADDLEVGWTDNSCEAAACRTSGLRQMIATRPFEQDARRGELYLFSSKGIVRIRNVHHRGTTTHRLLKP